MRKEIADVINNSPADQIYLVGLDIQDDELKEIAHLIVEKKTNVRSIFLANNNIGNDGTSIIKDIFPKLNELEFIDLQFNKISVDGAKNIFSLLSTHPNLKIALHGNDIHNEGEIESVRRNSIRRG